MSTVTGKVALTVSRSRAEWYRFEQECRREGLHALATDVALIVAHVDRLDQEVTLTFSGHVLDNILEKGLTI